MATGIPPGVLPPGLPNLIPPQTVPLAATDRSGAIIIEVNWYLFLYHLWQLVMSGQGSAVALGPGGIVNQIQQLAQNPQVFDHGEWDQGEPLAGPQGATGPAGPRGPAGPTVYLEALEADEPWVLPGTTGAQGPAGATGATGATGSVGPTGPAVYLEAPEADEPLSIPVQGPIGLTGAVGPTGPAVYLEAPEADEPLALPGAVGVQGLLGPTGPAGPAIYLEAPEADEPVPLPGLQGVQGNLGTTGPVGPAAHVTVDTFEIDAMAEALSIGNAIGPLTAPFIGPQATGSFQIQTGYFGLQGKRMQLIGSQRATVNGTGRLSVYN